MDCGSEVMPYYIDEEMPEWEEYWKREEAGGGESPASLFTYIEPLQANTTVLPFADTPGPEPEVPQRTAYSPPPVRKPGFFARLFGQKAVLVTETPRLSTEQLLENFRIEEEAASAHALWKVSGLTATCRALGVKRVFGSYDGGGDESFTHYHGVEMRDSRALSEEVLCKVAEDIDGDQLVEDAVTALMGRYGAGEFILRGAVIIDFDAYTITDEKDADVVFGDKLQWRG
jgi:hypothetical protein